MCEITDRLNRPSVWLTILAIALAVWGLTDVRHRARTDPKNPGNHRSDFTVYTTAGAAMFDGRDPYAVTNPRGWHYLYPPLFAILVAPLAALDTQWQGVIWYAISLLMAWGCYVECRRIWQWLSADDNPSTAACAAAVRTSVPMWISWLAGATVLFPVLNCLQRGQVGILLTYFLLLGFRCVVASRTSWGVLFGGVALALPIATKVIPALPAVCLCSLLAAVAARQHWKPAQTKRVASTWLGVAAGLLLFFFVIPSAAIGFAANAILLRNWYTTVVLDDQGKSDDDLSVHAKRNQSLANAIYRLGNWTAHLFGSPKDDQSFDSASNAAKASFELLMDESWATVLLRVLQLGLLGLLLVAGWTAAKENDRWAIASIFGLACLLMSAISPVFRGHYYAVWLPAVWIIPMNAWRNGRARLAISLAAAACALTWIHYLFLPIAGRAGVLGLGASVWYVVATISILRTTPGEATKSIRRFRTSPGLIIEPSISLSHTSN